MTKTRPALYYKRQKTVDQGVFWASHSLKTLAVCAICLLVFNQGPKFYQALLAFNRSFFVIKDIHIQGAQETSQKHILEHAHLLYDTPLMGISVGELQKKIEEMPWVAHATVAIKWPFSLHIKIHEHKPMAFWKNSERVCLLSEKGKIIATPFSKKLIILQGKEAPLYGPSIIPLLKNHFPSLYDQIFCIALKEEGCYVLTLKNGTKVTASSEKFHASLNRLHHFQKKHPHLLNQLTSIDLRIKDRLILRFKSKHT